MPNFVPNSKVVDQILKRLGALEAAVPVVGRNASSPLESQPPRPDQKCESQGLPTIVPAPELQDRQLPATAVAARYGVAVRTIDRWLANPHLSFPEPVTINSRRYWWLSRLRSWDRARHSSPSIAARSNRERKSERS